MTKQQIITGLTDIRTQAETHDNAAVRADMVEAIDKLTSAIEAMPSPETPDVAWLTEDYRIARQFLLRVRADRYQAVKDSPGQPGPARKLRAADAAGQALNRIASAAGVETPALTPRDPQPEQQRLIERRAVEVMA